MPLVSGKRDLTLTLGPVIQNRGQNLCTFSIINDGTDAFYGGVVCKKVSKVGEGFLVGPFNTKNFLNSTFALHLQACEGAETCIVSCHRDQKVWDGSAYVEFSYDRTSKLSEITGLHLTDVNIEDVGDGLRTREGFI